MATGPETSRREPALAARRFNLGDVAIVVAAVGVGCGLTRQSWLDLAAGGWTYLPRNSSRWSGDRVPALWFQIAGTAWAVATFAVLGMRLRRPRPRWRRLMRQPGWVACLAAAIAVVAVAGFVQARVTTVRIAIATAGIGGGDVIVRGDARFEILAAHLVPAGGLSVLVAWALLRADGRWAAERSWIDRAGRLIGVGWLLLPAGFLVVYWTSIFFDIY